MKNKKCPMRKHCWDYKDSNCDNCEIGNELNRLHRKLDRLKAENAKFKTENEELRTSIDVLLNPNF